MNTTPTATVSPAPHQARTSNVSAAASPPAPALHVSFAPHNAPSSDETPSTAAKAVTAAEQRKRTKLGTDIVALIESQKPTAIQELIFDLSTSMIALNTKVYDRTESAKRFDLRCVPITEKSWLPGNVKIKIGLQCTSELVDDEEYLMLSAECEKTVAAFQDDLNHLFYRTAVRERKYAEEKRLREFVNKTHKLFRAYTKHFSGIVRMGDISRPLDIVAALFLIRYMKESLNRRAFFGPDNYLGSSIEEATDTVAELVPGLKDQDAAAHITQPSSQTTATEAFRNGHGFTPDEEDLYKALQNSIDPYFATVTSSVQNRINGTRNELAENAKLAAWLASEKKEEATAATEAALATMSTMSPTTMTELVTK